MDLHRFFIIVFFIVEIPPKVELRKVKPKLAADAVEHLAVAGHGLAQVLHHSVLHKKYLQN